MQTRAESSPVSFGDDGTIVLFGRVSRLEATALRTQIIYSIARKVMDNELMRGNRSTFSAFGDCSGFSVNAISLTFYRDAEGI